MSESEFSNALIASTLVSFIPLIFLEIIPNGGELLNVFLCFASGGLIGDVFLHLIPHSIEMLQKHKHIHEHQHHNIHEHEHHHDSELETIGINIIIGFAFFFIIEKIINELSNQVHDHSSHSSHSNNENHKKNKNNKDKDNDKIKSYSKIFPLMMADLLHNVTDGLTIAASFIESKNMGIVQVSCILLHEMPHEIGDFSILIQNGFSKRECYILQIITGIGCILGTLFGFYLNNNELQIQWILPFTAGGFIYISAVQVLPIMVDKQYGIKQSLYQIMAWIFGIILLMYIPDE